MNQYGALVEGLDEIVADSMDGCKVCIAQVDHDRVFLEYGAVVTYPAALRLLNGIAAESADEQRLGLLQRLCGRADRPGGILVVGTDVEDVLDILPCFCGGFGTQDYDEARTCSAERNDCHYQYNYTCFSFHN